VPLKPGGVLFVHGLLHHGTPLNSSDDRRRALQFHYAAHSTRTPTDDEHATLFRDNGGYASCRRPVRRRMSERVF
jgi:phytanoyl-CoA hydroxylase